MQLSHLLLLLLLAALVTATTTSSSLACRSSSVSADWLALGSGSIFPACSSCSTGASLTAAGCACNSGSVAAAAAAASSLTCTPCAAGSFPDPTSSTCISCPTSATWNATTSRCDCPSFSRLVLTRNSATTASPIAACTSCPPYSYPAGDQCITCPDSLMTPTYLAASQSYQCTCPVSTQQSGDGSVCIPQTFVTATTSIYPNSQVFTMNATTSAGSSLPQSYTSAYLDATFLSAMYRCTSSSSSLSASPAACQQLANLCALVYWDPTHPICAAYFANQLPTVPSATLPALTSQVNPGPSLNVTVVSYALNGTVAALQPWASWMASLCLAASTDAVLVAGVSTEFKCKYKPAAVQGLLFEAYLIDSASILWPIPVISPQGRRVRRWFLFDTTVPASSGGARWATELGFEMTLYPGSASYSVPMIRIAVQELVTGYISTSDLLARTLAVSTTYTLATSGFWSIQSVLQPVLLCVFGGAWLVRASGRARRNHQPALVDGVWSVVLLVDLLFELLGPVLAAVSVSLSIYVWVFFEYQARSGSGDGSRWFMWLPSGSDQAAFQTLTLASLFVQLVHVGVRVLSQCFQTRVHLVDWEKPKADGAPVGTWRAVHVGRKWAEVSMYGRVSPGWIAVLVAAVVSVDASSWMTACAAQTAAFLGLCVLQHTVTTVFIEPYLSDPPTAFVDLLSVANISVVVLFADNRASGYYLHGRSVFPTADTAMVALQENLMRESTDAVGRRGLTARDDVIYELVPALDLLRAVEMIERVSADAAAVATAGMVRTGGTGGRLSVAAGAAGPKGGSVAASRLAASPPGGRRQQVGGALASMLGASISMSQQDDEAVMSANARRTATLTAFFSRWIDQVLVLFFRVVLVLCFMWIKCDRISKNSGTS
ncbi:transmembrane protein 67-domain-containing protein [Blastocladiella britannica]|nr:transmembrane protein 67-domain-containing protein [Blastocladiella britannica]